jgi:hypothetical protein
VSIPDSVTIVSIRDHVDEAVLRRRFKKMKRGEVCYLFPEPPELDPETTWHGCVQKVASRGAKRKREFAIQGHGAASEQRYREVGLESAVGFAMKIKPRAVIVV